MNSLLLALIIVGLLGLAVLVLDYIAHTCYCNRINVCGIRSYCKRKVQDYDPNCTIEICQPPCETTNSVYIPLIDYVIRTLVTIGSIDIILYWLHPLYMPLVITIASILVFLYLRRDLKTSLSVMSLWCLFTVLYWLIYIRYFPVMLFNETLVVSIIYVVVNIIYLIRIKDYGL